MRFPAAIAPKQPLRNAAGAHAHFIRRVVGSHSATQSRLEPVPVPAPLPEQEQDELPVALDERVRLVGEW